ncbi:MAG TPA: DNA mismatch repair protein MutS, partial [Saprospiraceae bacterium]|nr:DNA mismatch repair protein MutS [Saprospiraceae bacterium]
VEMNETASILNNLSDRSLVLMDEIGRGTSTYDGISIAWSIAEFLHEQTHQKAKTLFATHYHELNELALQYNGIKNFHVSTQEINNKVIFLRKLVAGGSEHSFGIHVAEMAGMPSSIVNRANEILHDLESSRASGKIADSNSENMIPKPNLQIKLAEALPEQERKVYEEIRNMDINTLSPIECMMKIAEWRKKLNL